MKSAPNMPDVTRFIRFVCGDVPATIQLFGQKKGQQDQGEHFTTSESKKIRKRIEQASVDGLGVALMINKGRGTGRKKSDVSRIRFLFIDCDGEKYSKEKLRGLPITPHAIVKSSPGRYHAYWVLTPDEN